MLGYKDKVGHGSAAPDTTVLSANTPVSAMAL